MSSATPQPGQLLPDTELSMWRRRIHAAKADRKRFEPIWQMCLAFAAGKHHLEWRGTRNGRQLYLPRKKPGEYRYTIDEITPLRMAMLGELNADDDRPEVLFDENDLPTEDYAHTFSDALGAGWDAEWQGDRVLQDIRRTIIDVGTAAVRCRFDPTAGPSLAKQVPHQDGRPILNPEKARGYVEKQFSAGGSADLRSIHQGAIRWDAGTPFNLLVPPGIKREDKFPWVGWVEPVLVDKVQEEYGKAAAGLKPDRIDDINGLSGDANADIPGGTDPEGDPGQPGKLEGHVFLYTIYETPTRKQPQGRVLVFAGQTLELLQVRDQLDYKAPDGTWRAGVHFFHYVRLTDRFWSKSLVELLKDANRAIDKVASQIMVTIDRGQPFILFQGKAPVRKGFPVEMIELPKNQAEPKISSGIAPGDWMFKQKEALREDMQRASGIQDVLQGQNPQNVGNYSQLALLQEQAGRKFDPVIRDFKGTLVHVVEDTCWDIARYWGPDKKLAVVGDEGQLRKVVLDATRMPDFYRVHIPTGATKPRSQAAELKKIDDLAAYSINSGQPLPVGWLDESYAAGKPVDLPQTSRHDQLDKALYENHMLEQGEQPEVAYYDDHALHVMVVRGLQARADAAQDHELALRCDVHAKAHEQAASENAAVNAPAPGAAPGAPGASLPFPHPSPYSLQTNLNRGPGNFGL